MPTQRGEANPASAGRRAARNKPHAAMPRRDGQPVLVPISVAVAGFATAYGYGSCSGERTLNHIA
jgi:hypothetical protein